MNYGHTKYESKKDKCFFHKFPGNEQQVKE
jgi:hypothetical protein